MAATLAPHTGVMPRLDRGIQYAANYRLTHARLGVLGRPVKPGGDSDVLGEGARLTLAR
ncbi:hypothetical protein GCM10007858_65880 [Bradyrhizobium liaoningense]|nr:hypothetical protein GCM10007858_65880 [Bradyrhizobium liaoningense]